MLRSTSYAVVLPGVLFQTTYLECMFWRWDLHPPPTSPERRLMLHALLFLFSSWTRQWNQTESLRYKSFNFEPTRQQGLRPTEASTFSLLDLGLGPSAVVICRRPWLSTWYIHWYILRKQLRQAVKKCICLSLFYSVEFCGIRLCALTLTSLVLFRIFVSKSERIRKAKTHASSAILLSCTLRLGAAMHFKALSDETVSQPRCLSVTLTVTLRSNPLVVQSYPFKTIRTGTSTPRLHLKILQIFISADLSVISCSALSCLAVCCWSPPANWIIQS